MQINQLTLRTRILGGFGILILIVALGVGVCFLLSSEIESTAFLATKHSTITAGDETQTRQDLDDIFKKSKQLNRAMLTAGFIVGVAGLILAWLISRSVTLPIRGIIDDLSSGSASVSAAASQITVSSQSLAVAASEQASSIEETSASLEEMANMTKRNADDAKQADALMQEANKVIATANNTMDNMTISMKNITQTSEDTQKIVKTIDEIAFQTNLLALNAAVEAARAGEAGAGFAVVADEVRNLAIRAAEAAKNTSEMIDGSVRQIKEGSVLLDTTNKAFDDVAVMAEKVTHLIGEIASASAQQAEGIEQVNQTIGHMDQRVQQNAASSEESASASEEMSSQAEQMEAAVNQLILLVAGGTNRNDEKLPSTLKEPQRRMLSLPGKTHLLDY